MRKPLVVQKLESLLGIPLSFVNDFHTHWKEAYSPVYRTQVHPAWAMVGTRYQTHVLLDSEEKVIGLNLMDCQIADSALKKLSETDQIDLSHLQALNLAQNQFTHFPFFSQLGQLVFLDLAQNANLKTISYAPDIDLGELQRLELYDCDLQQFKFHRSFQSLAYADLSRNKNLSSVFFAADCPQLQVLILQQTALSAFILREGFQALTYLYLNKSQLKDFQIEGTACPALRSVDLSDNPLFEGQKESELIACLQRIVQFAPHLETLNLKGSDQSPFPDYLKSIMEDKDSRKSNLPEVKDFLQDYAAGEACKNDEYKVLLIGNGGAGKTNIASRITGGAFNPDWDSTHGILLKREPLNGNVDYKINYWDFGGQEIYHSTHRLFLQDEAVYILAWSLDTDPESETPALDTEEKQYPLHYWLEYAKDIGKGSPVLIVQTKAGGALSKRAPIDKARVEPLNLSYWRSLAVESDNRGHEDDESYDFDTGYLKLRETVREAVDWKRVEKFIPRSHYEMRERLREKQKEPGKNILTQQEYQQLVVDLKQAGFPIANPEDLLQGWLFKSGVIYYRRNRLNDEIILNQNWAIEAIYTLFDRTPQDHFGKRKSIILPNYIRERQGKFSGQLLRTIWDRKGHTTEEQELFIKFMKSCDLCFEITAKGEDADAAFEDRLFLMPQLLNQRKPPFVDHFWDRLGGNTKVHTYVFKDRFLHEGIIHAIIARTAYIVKDLLHIWAGGIQISEEGQDALIEAYSSKGKEEEGLYDEIHVRFTDGSLLLLRKIRHLIQDLQKRPPECEMMDGQPFDEEIFNQDRLIPGKGDLVTRTEREDTLWDLKTREFTPDQPLEVSAEQKQALLESARLVSDEQIVLFVSTEAIAGDDVGENTEEEISSLIPSLSWKKNYSVLQTQAATKEDLQIDLYNHKPHILILSGKVGKQGLEFLLPEGGKTEIPAQYLTTYFEYHVEYLSLVLLLTENSQRLAQTISRLGIFTIGMAPDVPTETIHTFAQKFFLFLHLTQNIKKAFMEVTRALSTSDELSAFELYKDGQKV